MTEQAVDCLLVAVDDVEYAVRKTRFLQQLGEAQRQRRIALGRLQHERVTARNRNRKHPHRHHRREVERRNAYAHANGRAHRPAVDVSADAVAMLALQEMRNARCELDHFHAARHRPFGIGQCLAVFLRDDLRQVLAVPVQQVAKLHQHARTPQCGRRRPCTKRVRGRGDSGIDVETVGERHVPDDLAGGRVGHFAVARRRRRVGTAPDPHRQAFERCQVHRHSSIAGRVNRQTRCTKLVAMGCRFAAHCRFMRPLVRVAFHLRLYSHPPPGLRTLQRAHVHRQCAPGLARRAARSSDTLTREFSCSGSSRSSITAAVPLAVARAHAAPKSSVRCTLSAWAP